MIIPRLIEPPEWQTMEETGERWVDFSLSVLRDHKSDYTSNEVGVAGIVTLLWVNSKFLLGACELTEV